MNRVQNSSVTPRTTGLRNDGRPQANSESNLDMWSSMLDSVASGKRLPEKTILVFGGTPETQKDFLETLASDFPDRAQERQKRKAPVANEFALGYTYQDVLDTDHEDLLARLSIYLLSEHSASYVPLIKPLFTPHALPDTLAVILLDWAEPWLWVRQLRHWMRFLQATIGSCESDIADVLKENKKEWIKRRNGGTAYDSSVGGIGTNQSVTIPLDPGDCDEFLGLPLCVVCQSTDKIDILEKEYGWREEEFDFVLQFLRTILMRHGASLVYTSPSLPNSLPTLIRSTLGIHSLLKRQSLKHNVVDRDQILVPPNWDSWGKIRVLREGFDVEGVSNGWGPDMDMGVLFPQNVNGNIETKRVNDIKQEHVIPESKAKDEALRIYEGTISDPKTGTAAKDATTISDHSIETECLTSQDFLASQLEALDQLKAEEDKAADRKETRNISNSSSFNANKAAEQNERLNEHIGPVQFNMGGIQVDADDMLKRVKNRELNRTPEKGRLLEDDSDSMTALGKQHARENTDLSEFFAGLMQKTERSSPRSKSP